MRLLPTLINPDLCLTQEEIDLLKPVSLEELDTLMDEVDQQPPKPARFAHASLPAKPPQTDEGTPSIPQIMIYEAPVNKDQHGSHIPNRVSVKIPSSTTNPQLHADSNGQVKKRKLLHETGPADLPSTPKAQKLDTVTTPPNPTPNITTPITRSLTRTAKLQAQSPSRRYSPRLARTSTSAKKHINKAQTPKKEKAQESPTSAPTSTSTPQNQGQGPNKPLPIPKSWATSSAEDRLLFDLRKHHNSWGEVASEWNRITGRGYSKTGVSKRYHRMVRDIGDPPEGMELEEDLDLVLEGDGDGEEDGEDGDGKGNGNGDGDRDGDMEGS